MLEVSVLAPVSVLNYPFCYIITSCLFEILCEELSFLAHSHRYTRRTGILAWPPNRICTGWICMRQRCGRYRPPDARTLVHMHTTRTCPTQLHTDSTHTHARAHTRMHAYTYTCTRTRFQRCLWSPVRVPLPFARYFYLFSLPAPVVQHPADHHLQPCPIGNLASVLLRLPGMSDKRRRSGPPGRRCRRHQAVRQAAAPCGRVSLAHYQGGQACT